MLFQVMAQHADVAVAHNASFDRRWFGHLSLPALTLPWVCTCTVPWPSQLGWGPGVCPCRILPGLQIGDEHRSTLADCTVLAQIRDCCDDLETCLLSSLGWTKPQRQDKTLETLKWSRSRTVGRSSSGSSPRKTPSRAEARQRIEVAGEP